jgi:hypothetical protein
MVFASLFMAGLIISLVMVSRAATLRTKIVRECRDEHATRPSQQIVDILTAMSPAEKIALFPTLSVMSSRASSVIADLTPVERSADVKISA